MKDDNQTVSMNVQGIPEGIHRQFKHLCIDEKITMNNKLIQLIADYVQKNNPKVLK